MPALQVKDFPDDLYEELRQCAAIECRSVSQQTIYGLREFLRMHKAQKAVKNALWAAPYVTDLISEEENREHRKRAKRRREVLERIRERRPADTLEGFPDAVEIIREMREERTGQILESVGAWQANEETEGRHDRA